MPLADPDLLKYLGPTAAPTGGGSAPSGTDTNAATQWFQQQPWYRQTLASWGNPSVLSLGQRGYLSRMAYQAGLDPSLGVNTHGDISENDSTLEQFLRYGAFATAAIGGGSAIAGALGGGSSAAPTLEASMNAGTNATTSGIPAAFGSTAVDTVASSAPSIAASSNIPSWVRAAISAGSPLAIRALTSGGGSTGGGPNGLSPEQNDLLTQLIKMSMQRQQESAPVHQAAMALAGRLAPTGSFADSPRFQDAVRQTTGPGPVTPTNPNLAAAYAKLMGG